MKQNIAQFVLSVAVLAFVSGFPNASVAQTTKPKITNEGVAAVVNDDPITVSDVFERLKLIIITSGMPNNQDMQDRLRGQVMNMLIDEKLQMQEARQLGIKVTPEEIEGGFATIAGNNRIDPAKFKSMLVRDRISVRTLERQIEAQIAWGKVVQRKIRPQVDVTETDIDARQELLRANIGKTQYAVAEIFLPVESAAQEAEIKTLAEKLFNEIKVNHAPFPQVAAQFSQAAAAARGGDLGWVQEGELPQTLNDTLATMAEGDLSPPVRSLTGYHILLLRGKRSVAEENIPTRDQILEQIGSERLDRQQRRYLMDLKTEAFIDRRV